MPENHDVIDITTEVVNANTAPGSVISVTSVPSIDWTGDDILKISIVLSPEAGAKLVGDVPLNILVQLHGNLEAVGEARFPIIDYATTDELAAVDADSES